jgi:hypothetical protein
VIGNGSMLSGKTDSTSFLEPKWIASESSLHNNSSRASTFSGIPCESTSQRVLEILCVMGVEHGFDAETRLDGGVNGAEGIAISYCNGNWSLALFKWAIKNSDDKWHAAKWRTGYHHDKSIRQA